MTDATPLTFLCGSLATELRDLERNTLRYSPTQGRAVIRDGAADAILSHVANMREILRRIEDEHAVRLRLVADTESAFSGERDQRQGKP